MTATIHILQTVTSCDLPPDRVLESAMEQLDSVIIIGYTKDQQEFFASSIADGGTVLWLLERMKLKLLTTEVDR